MACPGPDKVPVANSRPLCRIVQMPKKINGGELGALCKFALIPAKCRSAVTISEPSCRIDQSPTKCRSRIRGLCVGLPRSQQSVGREFGNFVSGCPDSKNNRPRIRSHRVGLRRSRQSAGRKFGDLVTACPGPDKVLVASSGPSCRIGQILSN